MSIKKIIHETRPLPVKSARRKHVSVLNHVTTQPTKSPSMNMIKQTSSALTPTTKIAHLAKAIIRSYNPIFQNNCTTSITQTTTSQAIKSVIVHWNRITPVCESVSRLTVSLHHMAGKSRAVTWQTYAALNEWRPTGATVLDSQIRHWGSQLVMWMWALLSLIAECGAEARGQRGRSARQRAPTGQLRTTDPFSVQFPLYWWKL